MTDERERDDGERDDGERDDAEPGGTGTPRDDADPGDAEPEDAVPGDRPADADRDGDADADRDGDADADGADVLPPDELAGVVELFGALTPAELDRALAELAYRRGDEAAAEAAREAAIEDAVASYYLVEVERAAHDADGGDGEADGSGDDGDVGEGEGSDGERALLAPGPVAFPTLPAGAEDLPHLLEAPERDVDRERLASRVEARLRSDAARAVVADDPDRMRHLLDVTYDLDTWGPVDVADVRRRLDDALEAREERAGDAADGDAAGDGRDGSG
jgi:hypothetical protein